MAHAFSRRAVGVQRGRDLLIGATLVGQQQNMCPCQPSCRRLALADQPEQLPALLGRQLDDPLLLGHGRRPPERRRLSMPAGPLFRNSSVVTD